MKMDMPLITRKSYRFTMAELNSWNEDRFIEFFQFASIFTVKDESGTAERWSFDTEKVAIANAYLTNDANPFFKELALRINENKGRGYYLKMTALVEEVCGFIKRNPAFLTSRLREVVEGNTKFAWASAQYSKMDVEGVGTAIVPSSVEGKVRGREVEIVLMETQLKVIDIYSKIADSIKPMDIRKMKIEKKIQALKDLAPLIKRERLWKPNNVNVFLQNKESAEKLEASLLGYVNAASKKQEGENKD